MLGEHGADRLDTPSQATIIAVLVVGDERDYRFAGRSSSAAKKAEAAIAETARAALNFVGQARKSGLE